MQYQHVTGTRAIMSIVIPTLGRAGFLPQCLDDLDKIAAGNCEVIVVDQSQALSKEPHKAPHKASHPVYQDYAFDLRYFITDVPNASLARSIGLREARGNIVLFLDDDVRISNPDFLSNHRRHYANPRVSGVYGQVLEVGQHPISHPDPEEIEMNLDRGWMKLPANYAHRCRTRNGASNNLSVRREWALAVGGMDAWFEKGARREETEFNLRFTKRFSPLVFDPQASLIHLSAEGGSRAWGHVRRTVPMHHIVGHWYFLLRALRDRTLGAWGLSLELRFIAIALIKNPQVGRDPVTFMRNVGRALWGLFVALTRLMRGPRRIETLDAKVYREITTERIAR